jgi:hypothetical protein
MRQNNKPIIIHSLIERINNKKHMNGEKFDFCEEMSLEEKRKLSLESEHKKEIEREKEGRFVDVSHEGMNYKIFIHRDENMKARIKRFTEKLGLKH